MLKPTWQRRNLYALEFIFQLHSLPCPTEVPVVILYQLHQSLSKRRHSWLKTLPYSRRAEQGQSTQLPGWTTDPGVQEPEPLLTQFGWADASMDPLVLKIPLCKLKWRFRVLELEGTSHGSPQGLGSFYWCWHQDLTSCPQTRSAFTPSHYAGVHREVTLALFLWDPGLGLGCLEENSRWSF